MTKPDHLPGASSVGRGSSLSSVGGIPPLYMSGSAAEAEMEEAQRVARLGSWQWEIKADRVRWSKELGRLLLLKQGSAAPTYAEQIRFFTPESRRRLETAVERALRDGTPYELDLEMVRTDGKSIWVTARGEPVRGDSGELEGLRGTVLDISERKRAEQSLAESERPAAPRGRCGQAWDLGLGSAGRENCLE